MARQTSRSGVPPGPSAGSSRGSGLLRCAAAAWLAACASGGPPRATQAPAPPPLATYRVYVGAESSDQIHRVRFGPGGAVVEKTTPIGELPVEMEGPHGLAISPDGRYVYLSTGHGIPTGKVWKFAAGPDTLVGRPTQLGPFPATLDLTPDGLYAFVVNFNLHGDPVPSSVSVIYTPDLTEAARTTTCAMPHGSRVNPQGTQQYSACMMDDQLVELDTRTFRVSRRFSVAHGAEAPLAAAAAAEGGAAHGAGHRAGAAATVGTPGPMAMPNPSCSPTWAQPSADGSRIYVACNKSDEILEISSGEWRLLRRFPAGRGPYNLAVTPDGRLLVATLKQGAAVQFFDLASGQSLGTTPTSIKVAHGVAVSPDSRYAFVSVEGIGGEPGRVDIYDVRSLRRVASADVGLQASGIAFWRMHPAR
ncbi:MAG: beta-propeller fold lactonase family protein [Gemmatimonadetes bacterium]|nr:beta-propeller fold lactonase family protein [Gemmatimonadota bacterium]